MRYSGILAVVLALTGCTQQPAPVLSGYTGKEEVTAVRPYVLKAARTGENMQVSQKVNKPYSAAPAMREESLALIEPAGGPVEEQVRLLPENGPSEQYVNYTFQDRDTLYKVAREHGTTAQKLAEINGLDSVAAVTPGQVLIIPQQNLAAQPSAVGAVATAEKATATVRSQVIEKEKQMQLIEPAAGPLPQTGLVAPEGSENPQKTLQDTGLISDLKDYAASGGRVVEKDGVRYAEHLVAAGETVYRISLNYNASVIDVMAANDFVTPQDLKAGTVVRVPLPKSVQMGLDGGQMGGRSGVDTAQKAAEPAQNGSSSTQTAAAAQVEPAATTSTVTEKTVVQAPSEEGMAVTTVEKETVRTVAKEPAQGTIGAADQAAVEKVVTTTKTETKVVASVDDATLLMQKGRIDPLAAKAKGLAWPVKGKIIRKYGEAAEGVNHTGINIAVPTNTPVLAAETGTVLYADSGLKTYGNLVLIRHADGMVTAYAHNNKLLVNKGEKVKKGQVIALSGATGNVDSPQVHFEIRKEAHAIDPLRVLASR